MSEKNKKKKNKNFLLIRDGFFNTVLSLFTCYLLSLLFFNISFFNPIVKVLKDFSFLDTYYAEKLNQAKAIDTNIVLVNIGHEKRPKLLSALQKLTESKAKVIGLDVILKRFEETSVDTLLAETINHKKVVSASIVEPNGAKITNHSFFIHEGTEGFVNFNFDTQNTVIREFNGIFNTENGQHYSFALALAKKFLDDNKTSILEKKTRQPRVINYSGNIDSYVHLSVDELLSLENNNMLLEGKIVLMGYLGSPTANIFDVEDKHFTPLNKIAAGKSPPDMYGLVVHANILSMLIDDNFMYKVSKFWYGFIMFLCSLFASIYFIWLSRRLKISYRTVREAVLLVFSVLFIWFSLLLFKKGIVLKTLPIIAATIFSAGFVKYYKHLIRFIKTKRKFKSYLK